MRLLKVQSVKDIKFKLIEEFGSILKVETKPILEAFGRYLCEDVISPVCVPSFNKSRVDGYAVRFADCKIASETSPCILNLVGTLNIGDENKILLQENECMYIPTGGMLPVNSDAMVMIEHTEKLGDDHIVVGKATTLNQNITFVGDDVKEGSVVAKKGELLDERKLAILVSLGIKEVKIYKPLDVFILSSGDELVGVNETLQVGQTYEINSIFLSKALEGLGFNIVGYKLIKDNKNLYMETIQEAIETLNPDIILTSGGSSKGDKDYTVEVFEELTSNVFCEGIAIKPGKPTIIGSCNRLFIGLPGHPVSSYMVLKYIILQSYLEAIGRKGKSIYGTLSHNVSNSQGRETLMLCKVRYENAKIIVDPIYYNSTNIGVLAEADGYFSIGENLEGLNKDQEVEVFFFNEK